MGTEDKDIKNGWSEFAQSVLDKLKELHDCNKETRKSVEELKFSVEKLKASNEDLKILKEWKKDVSEVWSASNMDEAQKEIYIQKGKWSTVYGIIIAIQVIWVVIVAYLNQTK